MSYGDIEIIVLPTPVNYREYNNRQCEGQYFNPSWYFNISLYVDEIRNEKRHTAHEHYS